MPTAHPQDRRGSKKAAAAPHRRAFRNPIAVIVFLLIAVAGLSGDLISKDHVFDSLLAKSDIPAKAAAAQQQLRLQFRREIELGLRPADQAEPTTRDVLHAIPVSGDLVAGVRLTLSTNPGVVFGLPMPRPVVAVMTVITIGLVIFFFAAADARAYWTHISMAFILSGAVGNLFDRLTSEVAIGGLALPPIRYHVRDFIDCGRLGYPYIFNVADVFLVVGVAMLILHWLVTAHRERKLKKAGRAG